MCIKVRSRLSPKKIALGVCFFFFLAPCFGGIENIRLDELPADRDFSVRLGQLRSYAKFVDHYTPPATWNYPLSRRVLIDRLLLMDAEIRKQLSGDHAQGRDNYELGLLHFLVLSYLYNLEEDHFFQEAADLAERLKTQFPNEWRTWWFKGYFLAGAMLPLEGYEEFRYVLDRVPREELPAEFFVEYSFACSLVSMPKTALYALEDAARITGRQVTDFSQGTPLKNRFAEADIDGVYPNTALWTMYPVEGGYDMVSRMLGVSVYVGGEWGLEMSGYQSRRSFFSFVPEAFPAGKGETAEVSVFFAFDLRDRTLEDFIGEWLAGKPVTDGGKVNLGGLEFSAFFHEDPSVYPHLGGAKLVYLFAVMACPERPGLNIEVPRKMDLTGSNPGEVSYFTFRPETDRVKRDILLVVFLDSCAAVFDESLDFLYGYLDRCVFD